LRANEIKSADPCERARAHGFGVPGAVASPKTQSECPKPVSRICRDYFHSEINALKFKPALKALDVRQMDMPRIPSLKELIIMHRTMIFALQHHIFKQTREEILEVLSHMRNNCVKSTTQSLNGW
jgi:hypothetical protein